ncbi:MAG: lysylphosphatidylglycerol synthase domain-containing protein [Bacteroidales bacterium]
MLKRIFTYLFYASLIFLGYYLYKADYLAMPKIHSWGYSVISLILLLLGFLLQNINWQRILKVFNINTTLKSASISVGLSIFMKYIPGKVMVVLGRAAYISEKKGVPIVHVTTASLFSQIISLWVGFLLGSIALINADIEIVWKAISAIIFAGLSITLFLPQLPKKAFSLLFKLFKKDIAYPQITQRQILSVLPTYILTWLSWGFGFYFLTLALSEITLPVIYGMVFPLAGTLAIVSLFAPGGVGIREGLLVSSMVIYGIPVHQATAIALASRLWFLIGELAAFMAAVTLRYLSKNG